MSAAAEPPVFPAAPNPGDRPEPRPAEAAPAATILVIDDDRAVRHLIAQAFVGAPVTVISATSADEGLTLAQERRPDVVLLDIMLPRESGLTAFQQLHQLNVQTPIIFITSGGSSETAIEAIKLGAFDYLLKPLDVYRVQALVHQALEARRLMRSPRDSASGELREQPGDVLMGRSPPMLDVFKAIGRVAPQNVTVLIRGESGTGKELVARAIYEHSPRSSGPFLAVNCAALPDSLLESELFGHEKGAFTGAERQRIGKFEQCHGGTLFLDEIGDMSPLVQSKVLRILQEQKFERVGGNQTIATDVRIIVATHRNLEQMVRAGEYRSDLYYRLNGFTIELPPLRERGNDIRLLLEHFLTRYRHELGKKEVERIAPEAIQMLLQYRWPGNVRELQSVVRQVLLNATGPAILAEFLPEEIRSARPATPAAAHSGEALPESDLKAFLDRNLTATARDLYAAALEMMERYVVTRVLQKTSGNQSRAAQILGITRGSLRNKIRTLGILIGATVSIDGDDGPTAF